MKTTQRQHELDLPADWGPYVDVRNITEPALLVERLNDCLWVMCGNAAAADMFGEHEANDVSYRALEYLLGGGTAQEVFKLTNRSDTNRFEAEALCYLKGRPVLIDLTMTAVGVGEGHERFVIVMNDPSDVESPAGSIQSLLGGPVEVSMSADADGVIQYVCGTHESLGFSPTFLEDMNVRDIFSDVTFGVPMIVDIPQETQVHRVRVVLTHAEDGSVMIHSRSDLVSDGSIAA